MVCESGNLDGWRHKYAAALGYYLKLADRWRLSEDDQVRILQCGSIEQLRCFLATHHAGDALVMSADQLSRIAVLGAVSEAAGYLYAAEEEERRWLRDPNRAQPFLGRAPLTVLQDGSAEDIMNVRRYLMGLTQGGPGPNEMDQNFTPYTDDDLIWR